MNQNYLQLIIVLLIVGSSFITWVIRKLQEQRIRKAQRDAIERRRLELLRTGRDPGEQALEAPMSPDEPAATPSDPEAARRAELARRRREQIEMLRRRQAGQNAGQSSGQGAGGPASVGPGGNASASGGQASEITIQLPGGRVLRIPAPPQPGQTGSGAAGGGSSQRRPAPAAPRSAPKTAPTRSSPALERPKSRAKPAPALQPMDPTDTGESSTHRLVETRGAAAAGPVVTAASIDGKPMTAADWRRAFVAGQILGRPVAERRPGEEPLAPM